jgi:uncharacterized protein
LLPSEERGYDTAGNRLTPADGKADAGAMAATAEAEVSKATMPAVTAGEVVVDVGASGADPDLNELSNETLLPISGMVRLSNRELEIVDHPAFQRLFEIFQLGQTNLVYRGATHMRGEHAIGSVQVVTMMADATRRNAAREPVDNHENWQPGEALSDEEVAFARLGALLHDIGHLPAGHTLEDELGLLGRHDGDERIEMILDRTQWHECTYPPLRGLIDQRYAADARAASWVEGDGAEITASDLFILLISSDHKETTATLPSGFRVGVCRDLIGNTICADLLDYLHRDWLHLGKPRYFDPRLLEYLEILTCNRPGIGREDRLVINLKGTPRPRPDAVTAILDLLESRYQLFEIALFHRVKLAAASMLERVIAEYRDTFPDAKAQDKALADLTTKLLECSDAEMLRLFEQELLKRRNKSNAERVSGALDLVRRLRVRKLHRELHILYEDDIGGPEPASVVAHRFSGNPHPAERARLEVRRAANDRLKAIRTLENDFGLDPGDIVMYCPALEMSTKIAKVGIYAKGVVDSLAALDERNHSISGGHLKAQQERFRRLWRISFSIDESAYHRLEEGGMLDPLREAIKQAVLWVPISHDASARNAVRRIAEDVAGKPSSPWSGYRVVEPALNRERPDVEYPGGAPSISSFMGTKPKTARSSRRS